MIQLQEIVDKISKQESTKIAFHDDEDGGITFDMDKNIPTERMEELGAMILKEIYSTKGHGEDIEDNDEQMFNLYSVGIGDHLKYFQLFYNYMYQKRENIEKDTAKVFIDKLMESKIFDMSQSVANIISLTNCNDKLNRPFEHIFLNSRITIKESVYYGFLVTKFDDGREFLFTISPKKQQVGFYLEPKGISLNDAYDDLNIEKVERKRLLDFYYSFLMFLNEPEVILRDSIRTRENLNRRIKKGKTPLPEKNSVIELTGELLRYLNKIEAYGKLQYSHKFWVRGHYMSLWNQALYPNVYTLSLDELRSKGYYMKEGIVRVWKKPFIKGEGILINKKYEVKE